VILPTFTPTDQVPPTVVFATLVPTDEPVEAPTQDTVPVFVTSTPVGEAPVSSAAMTATALIAEAGEVATKAPDVSVPPTAVAVVASPTPFVPTAVVAQVATATPIAGPGGGNLTATALVGAATQLAAEHATATATALGTLPPSNTPTPTATLDPNRPTDCIHIVRRGETAYAIARNYGVTLDEIAVASGSPNLSVLSVGQELVIPECGNLTPTPGPTPTSEVPPTEAAPVGDSLAPTETPEVEGRTHLIQPGENLYRIALRYGVTMAALRNANNISNVNVIKAGDTLIIPER
jgi:LysM repeat protein